MTDAAITPCAKSKLPSQQAAQPQHAEHGRRAVEQHALARADEQARKTEGRIANQTQSAYRSQRHRGQRTSEPEIVRRPPSNSTLATVAATNTAARTNARRRSAASDPGRETR